MNGEWAQLGAQLVGGIWGLVLGVGLLELSDRMHDVSLGKRRILIFSLALAGIVLPVVVIMVVINGGYNE